MTNKPVEMSYKDRKEQSSWLKILLGEELTTVKELYLYGSVSKYQGDWLVKEEFDPSFDENSDYDFAVQDTYDTYEELKKLGWEEKDTSAYQDILTTHVMSKEIDGSKVQISLRNPLHTFKIAWGAIPDHFYWQFLNKRSPSFIGPEGVVGYLNSMFAVAMQVPKPKNTKTLKCDEYTHSMPTGLAGLDVGWLPEPAAWAHVPLDLVDGQRRIMAQANRAQQNVEAEIRNARADQGFVAHILGGLGGIV